MNLQGLGGFNPAQLQQRFFQGADADKSGGLSLDELKNAKPPGGAPEGVDVEKLFSSLDADGDGSLTQSELKPPPFANASGLSGDSLSGLLQSISDEDDETNGVLTLFSSASSGASSASDQGLADLLKEIGDAARAFGDRTSGSQVSSAFNQIVGDLYEQLLGGGSDEAQSRSTKVFA